MRVLGEVKELGVRLALNDFGTGYSSLSSPQRLPVDIVKIDQGFIVGVDGHPYAGALVTAISRLAHALGMTVTAEGVQTERQRAAVVRTGCHCFSSPAPPRRELASRLLAGSDQPRRLPQELAAG